MKKKAPAPQLFTVGEVEQLKKPQNTLEYQVMQLGASCGYPGLEVNGALMIGSGPEGWHAYAVLATEARIGEIERAMKRGEQG